MGGVCIDGPVKNNGGTVKIFPGNRLDIVGQDASGNSFFQTGSGAFSTIYAALNAGNSVEYTGTLVTGLYLQEISVGGTFGNIDINGGALNVQCFNPGSAYTAPTYPAVIMGSVTSDTPGTLSIDSGATLYLTNGNIGAGATVAVMVGNLTFNSGSTFLVDCRPSSTSINCCTLHVIDLNASDKYKVTISSTNTTLTFQIRAGTMNKPMSGSVLDNESGGNNSDNGDKFTTINDSNNDTFTFTGSWDPTGLYNVSVS